MPTFYAPMEGYPGSRVGETYFTTTGGPSYSDTQPLYGTTSGFFTQNTKISRSSTFTGTIWLQGYTKIASLQANTGVWLGQLAPYSLQGLVARSNGGGNAVTFALAIAYFDINFQGESVTTHPVGAGAAWFRWQYRNGPTSSSYYIFTGDNINGVTPNITATTSASGYYNANGGAVSFNDGYLLPTVETIYYDNLVVSDTEPPAVAPPFIPHSSVRMINGL